MKVAICAAASSPEAELDERMGRCPFFAIRDADGTTAFIPNEAQNDSGAGVKAARNLLKLGIKALIVGNIGPKAFEILNRAGVTVYEGQRNQSIEKNLALLDQGKLQVLKQANN